MRGKSTTNESNLTTGHAALKAGLLPSQLRALVKRNKVPFERVKFGMVRVLFNVADIPAIRAAAVEAGYLPKSAEVALATC